MASVTRNELVEHCGEVGATVILEAMARGANRFAIEAVRGLGPEPESSIEEWRLAMSEAEEREASIEALAEEIRLWASGSQPFIGHDAAREGEQMYFEIYRSRMNSREIGEDPKSEMLRVIASVSIKTREMTSERLEYNVALELEDSPISHAVDDTIATLKEAILCLEENKKRTAAR